MKREHPPYEDQRRRSSSTGHALEGAPAVQPVPTHQHQHQHQHQLPPYSDSQPRHMNYDHGPPSVPPTPGGYRNPYQPPTPMPQHQYDHPGYPSSTEPYYNVYSSSASKKKNTRASQACDQCRTLKAKCDETKPCKTCRDKGTECRYRDPIPKATDKAQADILDGIAELKSIVLSQSDRLDKLESAYIRGPSRPPAVIKPDPVVEEEHKNNRGSPHTNSNTTSEHYSVSETSREHAASTTETAPSETTIHAGLAPEHWVPNEPAQAHPMAEDEVEAEPGPPVPPGEPAIPHNHTTLAGLLLEWPAIREITHQHLAKEGIRFISEFPISVEQNRGALILYGRGEDSVYAQQPREIPDHGMLDVADDASDMASPSPAPDYGQLGGLSPPDQVEYKGGVLTPDGNPDFSEAKVWTFVESFKSNILNMHPIVQPKALDSWVKQFLDSIAPSYPRSARSQASKAIFAVSGGGPPFEGAGVKRKRSPGPDGPDGPSTPHPAKPGKPNRSVNSALVLTVLALGKICLHRDNIPDAVHNVADPRPHGSPRNFIAVSPAQGSPPVIPNNHSSMTSSPKDADRSTPGRRSSLQQSGTSAAAKGGYGLKKNYDVIPGLDYFAYATDILGNQLGAYNMKNVYANIFASLYWGQLERPMQAYSHINGASNKLLVILRPSLDRLRRLKTSGGLPQETKYNQLCLAFWTCLQLESDIIAELPLPASGLLSYEEEMPMPNMSLLEGCAPRICESYMSQLYLRKQLNTIHRMYYSPTDPAQDAIDDGASRFRNVELLADGIASMSWVPTRFRFTEREKPATEILGARLRAKFYGAMMITYRPFIRQILKWSYEMRHNPGNPDIAPDTEFPREVQAPAIDPRAREISDISPEIIDSAKKGIPFLIESTRAFHGLDDQRPIITNVFGTAHAQWGNLLVLTACWKDPILGGEVSGEILRELYRKTILFLRQSATATSSLKIDLHILEGMERDLWPGSDLRTGSSFSSYSSAPTPMAAPPPFPR